MKIEMADNEMTIHMGYRGSLDLIIKFWDQNSKEHSQLFEIRVYGEKPTILTIDKAPSPKDSENIFKMTDRD